MESNLRYSPSATSCPACGSGHLEAFSAPASDTATKVSLRIVECGRCGLAWQNPVHRSTHESAQYFNAAYGSDTGDETSFFNAERRAKVAQIQLEAILEHVRPPARLLDLGGGDGYFARAARDVGWEVTLSDPAVQPDQERLKGISTVRDGIAADQLGRFDVVTMWDVVEHLPNPPALLSEAVAALRTGGWLFIETGNHRSWDRANCGRTHWIYQADHRWYFEPKSLSALLQDLGLRDVCLLPTVLRPGWQGSPSAERSRPGTAALLRQIFRQPNARTLRRWRELREAARWPDAGLEIFTLTARK